MSIAWWHRFSAPTTRTHAGRRGHPLPRHLRRSRHLPAPPRALSCSLAVDPGVHVASTTMAAPRMACSALRAGAAGTPSSSRARRAKRSRCSGLRLHAHVYGRRDGADCPQLSPRVCPGAYHGHLGGPGAGQRACRGAADGAGAARAEFVADCDRRHGAGVPVVQDDHLRAGARAEGVVGAVPGPVPGRAPAVNTRRPGPRSADTRGGVIGVPRSVSVMAVRMAATAAARPSPVRNCSSPMMTGVIACLLRRDDCPAMWVGAHSAGCPWGIMTCWYFHICKRINIGVQRGVTGDGVIVVDHPDVLAVATARSARVSTADSQSLPMIKSLSQWSARRGWPGSGSLGRGRRSHTN